jgi:hypothetical protein
MNLWGINRLEGVGANLQKAGEKGIMAIFIIIQ